MYKFKEEISASDKICFFEKIQLKVPHRKLEDYYPFFIEFENSVIGWIELDIDEERKQIEIDRFEIINKYRRNGHGSRIILEVIYNFKSEYKGYLISLNPYDVIAKEFFEKIGFEFIEKYDEMIYKL